MYQANVSRRPAEDALRESDFVVTTAVSALQGAAQIDAQKP